MTAKKATVLSVAAQIIPLLIAITLWLVSVHQINPGAMTDYGLLPALPITYFLALACLLMGFIAVLSRRQKSAAMCFSYIVGLIFILHGTVPLLFSEPHYAWQYKHFGVVNYLNMHGSVNENVDIYQGWPGFFAICAWFTRIAGFHSGPVAFAAWSQVFFETCNAGAFLFLAYSLRLKDRVMWIATLILVVGNWIGQDYLAPQAFGFFLSILVFGVIFRWLVKEPAGPLMRLSRFIPAGRLEQSSASSWAIAENDTSGRKFAIAIVLVLFSAIVISHQLSPYLIILGVFVLTALDMVRPRWLILAMGIIAVGYLLHDVGFVQEHYGIIDTGKESTGQSTNVKTLAGKGLPGEQWAAKMSQCLSLAIWGLAAIGFVFQLKRGKREIALGLLMATPACVLAVQNYGGEAIYRVYLFSLPWAAILAAYALVPLGEKWVRRAIVPQIAMLAVLVMLFLPSYFGLEEDNIMSKGDVTAATHFYKTAPSNSVLMVAIPNFPVRLGGRYDEFKIPTGGDYTPNLIIDDRLRHKMLGTADLPTVESDIRSYGGAQSFLAFSKSQETHAALYGYLPTGSLQSLQNAVATSPDWRVWYSSGDCTIYQLISNPT